ncbi:autotransporter outer membrane beta-barrel domain-containing protein [Chryseobacterium turcicum]|uniref:Uncharacterized protein n=1 Tax=Chryseobacterium turcicum TaxID=2898076 RepID=A0A9Q3V0J3_9FLAO|nr:hypothetical protein [Chryseobacterium turcicum]MCD1115523.1 hypothetical protein [Chryseobacterium turcicum]
MKKQIFTILLFSSVLAYSQVGINTETPKATLDVTGKPSDISKIDGLIAPRLTGLELKAKDALYGAEQNATLIYVTEALVASDTSSKTANVTSIGYFYFDGNIWQKLTAASTGNAGNDWSLLGNSGTNTDVSSGVPNFIGTTDAVDFVVKTDNTERERIYKAVNADNSIKKITGGDLNVNGITVGRGKGNNSNNTVVGLQGLSANTTGGFNTGLGSYVLSGTTTGTSNVAIGHSSLYENTTGGSNVSLGASSLVYNTTGGSNVAIGKSALSNPLNKTGSHNIAIGTTTANALEDGTTNNIAIGSRQQLANATGSNQLNIGGVIFGTGLTGNEINPAGNIGIGTSTLNPYAKLDISSNNQGILTPKVNLTSITMDLNPDGDNNISNQPAGLLVYNNGTALSKGYYFWNGTEWRAIDSSSAISPSITQLLCSSAILSPSSYTVGQEYTGNLKITYSGGNGGYYSSGTSVTVNGLVFTLRPGKLEYGSGELVFSVTSAAPTGPVSNDTMNLPLNSSLIPFLTATQSCAATIFNQTTAEIKTIAAVGYASLTTDANGAIGHTFRLATPDGLYAIRVWFRTATPTTSARPHVQVYNNSGQSKTLYWNYNTTYGGNIAQTGILPVPSGVWGGEEDQGNNWYTQTTGNDINWGNEGIMDGNNNGPEYRRYSWIDNSANTKVQYSAYIYAGAPNGGSTRPDQTKIYIKIEQVTAP